MFKFFYCSGPLSFLPPRIQCHRGYWVEGLLQNSLASIQKAYELGYEMSEFDVRMTKDEHVILFHDDMIGDKKISEMMLSEVKDYHKVDHLDSVLSWFATQISGRYFLNIEIKSKFKCNRILERKVLDVILKYNLKSRVLISSFNPLTLFYFRKNCPEIIRSLLLTYDREVGNTWLIRSQILNILAYPHFLHLHEKYWSLPSFKGFLRLKIPVILWTCNDSLAVKKYFSEGVYGVISDTIAPSDII